MKVTVLGVQAVDYFSKKKGAQVTGTTIHAKFKDAQVDGEAVQPIYVSDNLNISCIPDLRVGQVVDVVYNNRGYVCDAQIVK